ncbi:MAG: alanine--tRNA ligase [Gammaproteobacteria bacterium]|nr:MAG: alanine--tRNA ligase [Gammaproteobacteria bacterium]
MNTAELRAAYLAFFEERGHQVVPSSTLVPANDPTLLFTNAGMVQFKDALLGREDLGFDRATSAQRCVRAGGKHNDLENVGYTARHHTFFEMMGNFSFGAYFKEETITWAWEFVTEVVKLPVEKIWVTVHPTDSESRRLWEEKIGLPRERVIDIEDNFWAMGDTGPCGPCTELFYDHGPEVEGGPPGSPEEDGDRYIEFWNLVFPQYDRSPDGELTPLPQPGVDTGLGLERMAAILQGVHSNYEIDLFRNLIRAAGQMAGFNDEQAMLNNASLRVIADHIRSSAFLIADGVIPGNEDRNYVLRRIIRRGLRHGYKLDITEPFFHKLVDPLVEEMGEAYPILVEHRDEIMRVLAREEARFAETLNQGMDLLNRTIDNLQGKEIPGDLVFQLYDTFGFPVDLTADVARERGLSVDMDGFEAAMEAQRARGRAAAKFDAKLGQRIHTDGKVAFIGYSATDGDTEVVGLYDPEGAPLQTLAAGDSGVLVLAETPFYAESGGQIGDTGLIESDNGRFRGDQFLHIGEIVEGSLATGEAVRTIIDEERRRLIRLNHSATHLMHAALRQVLGAHVQQKGSLVASDRLRFDFSHPEPVSQEALRSVEAIVNEQIQANSPVDVAEMSYDAAIEKGAMALFGEKYGSEVRVLSMGNGYSVELCGGTHVDRTGDIGLFRITGETGIAAGVRRVEAVTGPGALAWTLEAEEALNRVANLVKGSRVDAADKVGTLLEENKRLGRELAQAQEKLAASQGSDLVDEAVDVDGIKVLAARVEGESKALMQTLDTLKSKLGSAAIVLGHVEGDKVSLIAGVSKDLSDRLKAPDLINAVGAQVGAKGGGRPDMARAGGGDKPDALAGALSSVPDWVREQLEG